jgi:8-amino-3,8-dideoxy-alpha-D-manno-octulosonate transaminase
LKKLDFVIDKQRKNAKLILNAISELPIEMRSIPTGSYETADALVFFVQNNKIAKECRDLLLKNNLGTKILPEAITWHFAGSWGHMKQLVDTIDIPLEKAFSKSKYFIDRAVALPITVKMDEFHPKRIQQALSKVLGS